MNHRQWLIYMKIDFLGIKILKKKYHLKKIDYLKKIYLKQVVTIILLDIMM